MIPALARELPVAIYPDAPGEALRARVDGGRAWRERRARNLAAFRSALGEAPGLRVLEAPFAATLAFDSPGRCELRAALIAARVCPAVLWPPDESRNPEVPPRHCALSRRLLSRHCDFRYGERDMERVAVAVRGALSSPQGGPRPERGRGPDVELQGLL